MYELKASDYSSGNTIIPTIDLLNFGSFDLNGTPTKVDDYLTGIYLSSQSNSLLLTDEFVLEITFQMDNPTGSYIFDIGSLTSAQGYFSIGFGAYNSSNWSCNWKYNGNNDLLVSSLLYSSDSNKHTLLFKNTISTLYLYEKEELLAFREFKDSTFTRLFLDKNFLIFKDLLNRSTLNSKFYSLRIYEK